MAAKENLFSELVLGRIYNFRENDKSCIYNYKSPDHVINPPSLLGEIIHNYQHSD